MKVLDFGFVELVGKTGHMTTSVVDAARCSYGSKGGDPEKDQKLVRFLLGNGHSSPFRHAFFTFHIKAPLFVFRQIWKYQVGSTWREYETIEGESVTAVDIMSDTDQGCSWNELSGRYKVMEPEFYSPDEWRQNTGKQAAGPIDWLPGQHAAMTLRDRTFQDMCMKEYNSRLDAGIAKELARLVLPPSIYSECYWTVSLQAVLHFLDQRLEASAQMEIRSYAQAILDLIRPDLEAMGITR